MLCSLAYFYMVAAWGGYTFIINIIPIYVLGLIFIKKFNMKVYIAYSVFYAMGSLLAMQIQFVNLQVIRSSEHLASHGVFFIVQGYVLVEWLRAKVTREQFEKYSRLVLTYFTIAFAIVFVYASLTGLTRWSGRSMTLLDPSYAKKYIPIIASVSEHQPSPWSSFYFDVQYLIIFMPVGLYFCLYKPTYGMLFVALYGVLSVYFACVMIRLMLVFAPACCVLAGIGASELVTRLTKSIKQAFLDEAMESIEEDEEDDDSEEEEKENKTKGKGKKKGKKGKKGGKKPEDAKSVNKYPFIASVVLLTVLGFTLSGYVFHSTWAAAEAYSSPSIILASRQPNGDKILIDDYREAYDWIRQNTDPADKIMSWWDYGYQITGMANRTVLADGNTWNNTHIATIGKAFASTEEEGYKIARHLDADYVLIIFGGLSYYSGDDVSKFIWMIRIAQGVYPEIVESSYFANGQYRVDAQATDTMKNSLMYRLAYHRFNEVRMSYQHPAGFDTVRNMAIDPTPIKLKYFTEVYTTQRWILRVYKVNKDPNRDDKVSGSIL